MPEVTGARLLILWTSRFMDTRARKKIRACHAKDFLGCRQLKHAVFSNMCQEIS